uniref:EGF domain-specific O-linked N-acetylglucosamine transferase-like n=1 Tax=Oncorhynchus gorbuscha TaxID=8017 RepID=UPI001EAF0DDB|nr:EGF domain-specific O-linked N-acetylglucosamine transferase-like [Oncorhynchus gorbuscha]
MLCWMCWPAGAMRRTVPQRTALAILSAPGLTPDELFVLPMASSLEAAQELFWKQAYFGYVRERLSEMTTLCKATNPGDSSLKCTHHTRFCRATNLYLDLRNPRRGHERYKEGFLQEGEIGGLCSLNRRALAAEGEHIPGESCFYRYGDLFSETWKAFSDYDIIHLKTFDTKRVCFKDVVFTLLPRMRYGLFYNTPMISDCHSEVMFRAFSQYVLYRLNIPQDGPKEGRIGVMLLARSTDYRKTLNQQELTNALKTGPLLEVKVVDYKYKDVPFLQQLRITHNSDIFIGIQGAGRTLLLFLPDWAVIFELYNCQDESCYRDLARLRGIRYATWQKRDKVLPEDKGHRPTLGEHPKFTNYSFDVEEFVRLVLKAADFVLNHPEWKARLSRDEL